MAVEGVWRPAGWDVWDRWRPGRGRTSRLPEGLHWRGQGVIMPYASGVADRGLERPEAVREAVHEYREEADAVGEFLASECVTGSGHRVKAGELYEAYAAWAREAGLMRGERLGPRLFGMRMRARFLRRRTKAGHEYLGLGLTSPEGVGCSMV